MADSVIVRLDRAAIRLFERDPAMAADVTDAGWQLARRAAEFAPKATGAGAASIQPFPVRGDPGAADVSWDQDSFYLIFQEDGTRFIPAHHFLRGAYESFVRE